MKNCALPALHLANAILFWPVDEKAILPVLKKAHDQGVATINIGYNFMRDSDR